MQPDPPIRVLVVEHDPETAALAQTVLANAGYQAEIIAGDALAQGGPNDGDYQLVLADAGATLEDGQPVLRAIRTHPRLGGTPVLALVGAQPIERHLLTGEIRADDYLSIPFQPRELLHRVATTLDLHHLRHSAAVEHNLQQRLHSQLVELNTLSAIGKSLTSELDLDRLLTRVAEAAANLTHAEESLLLLLDEDTNELYMRAHKGVDSQTAEHFRVKSADSQAFRVLKSGTPLLIDSHEGWQKIKTEYLVKSMVYVPLSIRGQTIGVLGVNNRLSDRNFTTHDLDLLLALASHAAIALHNARLYQESEERRRELRTLIEIGHAVSSTLALEQVLQTINTQVMRVFNVGWCFIFSCNEDCEGDLALQVLAERRHTVWSPDLAPRLDPVDSPATGAVLNEGRWLVTHADDAGADPADTERLRYQGVATCLRVPIEADQHVVGLVECRYHERREGFGNALANRLQNQALPIAFILDSEEGYLRRASDLLRLTRELASTAAADWCAVHWWNEEVAQLVNVCSVGESVWLDAPSQVLDTSAMPALVEAMRAQTPISATLRDARSDAGATRLLRRVGGQAMLAVPLAVKGQTTGMLLLIDTLNPRQFSRREKVLARGIADQAALAVDNARLFRKLEHSMAELRQAQSNLVTAARLSAMGELAAAIAHQINNPLTTILGDAELLLQDLPQNAASHESAAAIFRAGQRAHEVVRRLLGMARHDRDETPKPTDVNATIRTVLALAERHLIRGGVSLHTNLADNLPLVDAVPNQLEDVWLNLLLNGRDAVAEQRGKVGIESRVVGPPDAPMVEVAVWDNGYGIPAEEHERIFEPFVTTKAPGEGTGLGLYICRQVVDLCKGKITVESTPGAGSRFTVLLPTSTQTPRTDP